MPQNFIPCDRSQSMLMPPDMREWLPPEHLAFFLIGAAEDLDLEPFYASYRQDGHGRAAFDPQMMVALLLYSYAVGERSSRKIERRCSEDVAYRVICAHNFPDHATIARFRARHEEAIEGLFSGILGLCAEAGMLRVGELALDSTKLAADASGHANRDYAQIASEILAEAAEIDRKEDELYGDRRGDELPAELVDPKRRRELIEGLRRRQEAERKERGERPSSDRAERLEQCSERLTAEHQARLEIERGHKRWRAQREAELAAEGKAMRGRRPQPKQLPATPEGKINTTDPDSRSVRTPRGFIQGYNAHAVTTVDQIIVTAELSTDSSDGGHLEPMIDGACAELEGLDVGMPQSAVADSGYWKRSDIERLEQRGIEVLVPPDGAARTKPPPPSRRGGAYGRMREKLKTDEGAAIYSKRQWMTEPVFAQIKVGRGIGRFKRRGLAACRSEWKLIAATHNLLKLHRAQIAAPAV